MSERSGYGSFFVGFLAGAVAGAIATVLYAPNSGEETRAALKGKKEDIIGKANISVDDAVVVGDVVDACEDGHIFGSKLDNIRAEAHQHLAGSLPADATADESVIPQPLVVELSPVLGDGVAEEHRHGLVLHYLVVFGIAGELGPVLLPVFAPGPAVDYDFADVHGDLLLAGVVAQAHVLDAVHLYHALSVLTSFLAQPATHAGRQYDCLHTFLFWLQRYGKML